MSTPQVFYTMTPTSEDRDHYSVQCKACGAIEEADAPRGEADVAMDKFYWQHNTCT